MTRISWSDAASVNLLSGRRGTGKSTELRQPLENMGDTARALGRLEEAEAAFRESLEIRRALRERIGDTPEALRDLSISLVLFGSLIAEAGRAEEAVKYYTESLELWQRLHLAFPDVLDYAEAIPRLENLIEEIK